jgi:hypothetical protein
MGSTSIKPKSLLRRITTGKHVKIYTENFVAQCSETRVSAAVAELGRHIILNEASLADKHAGIAP